MLRLCARCQDKFFPEITQSPLHFTARRFRVGGGKKYKFAHGKQVEEARRPRAEQRLGEERRYAGKGWRRNDWGGVDLREKWSRKAKDQPTDVEEWKPTLTPDDQAGIIKYVQKFVRSWRRKPLVHQRLRNFGIPQEEMPILLRGFEESVLAGDVTTPEAYQRYALVRFGKQTPTDDFKEYTDMVMTSVLYAWATDTTPLSCTEYATRQEELQNTGVSGQTLTTMSRLFRATSNPFPPDKYSRARRIPRKFIMHVGPTNSGKTHNALRALAAAPTGIYAGPLRLLAHEIWHRLNTGKIVPLGVEEKEAVKENESLAAAALDSSLDDAPPSPSTTPAFKHSAARSKDGNPEYARLCNMVTGEELRIVSDVAPITACTVEMLNPGLMNDVAVIDEIQMIADETRGSAWTFAVLGVNAKEIHLCGEETAVPVVRELLKGTNDEITVHRYERLTPLTVEEKSLRGDLSKVQKGDCIVAFSRSRIFQLKKKVEKETGMKCVVVYGQLPPELRSKQADLFNDPDNGYDVIIGSDAIGMGLNLKIRRVIFDSMEKWNGGRQQALSVSQTKQIAGRAGRYGLGASAQASGLVTTLEEEHLPMLKQILSQSAPELVSARLDPDVASLEEVSRALPEEFKWDMHMNWDAHRYIGILGGGTGDGSNGVNEPGWYRYCDHNIVGREGSVASITDDICQSLSGPGADSSLVDTEGAAGNEWITTPNLNVSYADRLFLTRAPIPWKIKDAKSLCLNLVMRYLTNYTVSMKEILEAENEWYLDALEQVEEEMGLVGSNSRSSKRPPKVQVVDQDVLAKLEVFHRILSLYNWLNLRNPVAFHDVETVVALKPRVELALQWALNSTSQIGKRSDRGMLAHEKDKPDPKRINWVSAYGPRSLASPTTLDA